MAGSYIPRAEGQARLRDLGFEPIENMQGDKVEWWLDPYGYKAPIQVHGPNQDYYRVQIESLPRGLELYFSRWEVLRGWMMWSPSSSICLETPT